MWWTLQILATIGVCISQIVNRKFGINTYSWGIYSLIAMSWCYFTFAKSYSLAPSFTSAWFIGQTSLNILGILVGLLYFHDPISLTQLVGISMSVLGGYFIIFG